jgi:hypothetical protein
MKHPETWFRWLSLSWRRTWRRSPQAIPLAALFVAVTFIGISEQVVDGKLLTSWRQNKWTQPHVQVDRSPAAFEGCAYNQYRLENLVLDNERMEKSFPPRHNIQGRWLHLDLAKLNFAQARLLSKLPQEHFRPFAVTLATCSDIPCLYDMVSGDAEREYGALAWHWFLKTGLVVEWKGTDLAFSKAEMKNLWALAQHLTPDFFHQHVLSSIEKSTLPDGQCFSVSHGHVKISMKCAVNEFPSLDFQGHVTAGMSEALLPHWLNSFPEWQTKLSKKSPGTWRDGKWQQSTTDVSALAPQVAQFVLHGEAAPELKDFLHDQLFKRDWSMQGEMHREFKRDQWVWRDVKNRHLKDCLDLHKSAMLNKAPSRGLASLSEPHPMAQCLRQTAVPEFLQNKRAWLSSGHARSCDWSKPLPQGQIAIDAYLSHWESLVSKDVDQLEWRMRSDGPHWLRDYQAKEASLAKLDPTWVYFECHNGSNPKSCYQQGLTALLTKQGRLPSSVKEELLDDYPFEALNERVNEDVGSKRQWLLARLEEEAAKSWRACWREGPNSMVKISSPLTWVSPGVEFIDGRFARCLESSSLKLMEELAPGDAPEARYWRSELTLPLKRWWKTQIAKEAEEERGWLWQSLDQIKTALSADLEKNMQQATFDPQGSCLARLTYHYPPKMYFHDRQQLNTHLGANLCRDVLSSAKMQKSLTEHKNRRWKILGGALQSSLSPMFQSRVRQHCLGRVPAAQAKALLQTEAVLSCMKDQFELSWPLVSEKVASRYNVPGESLDQFKNDVETIAKAVLSKQLQP